MRRWRGHALELRARVQRQRLARAAAAGLQAHPLSCPPSWGAGAAGQTPAGAHYVCLLCVALQWQALGRVHRRPEGQRRYRQCAKGEQSQG